jgi:tetratricopeptide (TPR) repeat protein
VTQVRKGDTVADGMFFSRLPSSGFRRVAALLVLVVATCGAAWGTWRLLRPWLFPPDPRIVTPQIALKDLSGRSIYFNGLARPWLLKLRPDLLTAEDRDGASQRSRGFVQAPQNPRLFRQLDRQYRFDTVLLIGDPSNYQRLLDHFLEPDPDKRDFRLVYLDHWAFVFKRGAAQEWQPEDSATLRRELAGVRDADRASGLAQAAGKMLAIRRPDEAKKWLDEARSLGGDSADVLAGLAAYEITLGRWKQAETFAEKAIERDGRSVQALAAKILALRATGYKIDAFKTSEKLNELIPEDPVRLWQHGQLAHEAGRIPEEIKVLTRLVELARAEGRPTGEYEFFLGQAHAYAAMDDVTHAPAALKHLRQAITDPLLTAEQRKFAEERITIIRERTGLK